MSRLLDNASLLGDANLIAYWPFLDTDIRPELKGNFNFTKTGTVNLVAGKYDKCASATFSNANKLTNTSVTAPGTGDLTISAWFQKASAPSNDFTPTIVAWGTANRAYLVATKTNGYAAFYTWDGAATNAISTTAICDGLWHSLICVRSSTSHVIYVDGISAANTTGTARNCNSTTTCVGGGNDATFDWIGAALIDDVAFFNRALTAAEIYYLAKSPSINYIKQYRRTRSPGTITGQ